MAALTDYSLFGNPAVITLKWKTCGFAPPAFAGFAFIAVVMNYLEQIFILPWCHTDVA
jgi:hypothetical protein